MPKYRTVAQAALHIREVDPETSITESAIRHLIAGGKVRHITVGKRVLLDFDQLEQMLTGKEV